MDTHNQQSSQTALPEPKSEPVSVPAPPQPVRQQATERRRGLPPLVLVAVCTIAGFGGGWLYAGSGLFPVSTTNTITERKERVIAEGEVVADVAETVAPSVVSIVTETISDGFFGLTPQAGAGTGIIISKDGYVLTNKHVIPSGTRSVSVVTTDGTVHEDVEVIGRDPLNDIAFLKIRDVSDLTPATLGDSDAVQVGQKVVAIGNALGQFETTVTSGIISGVGRPLVAGDSSGTAAEQLENLFQTDAAINPGNSGGPLVDINGAVIGINTAIAQDAEGIGFAIPINDAKGLIKSVLGTGELKRAYLGVRYVMLTSENARQLETSETSGAYIGGSDLTPVIAGSPADQAGLRSGDVIKSVEGTDLTERRTLASVLSQYTPGDTVTMGVVRDGRTIELRATLGEYTN